MIEPKKNTICDIENCNRYGVSHCCICGCDVCADHMYKFNRKVYCSNCAKIYNIPSDSQATHTARHIQSSNNRLPIIAGVSGLLLLLTIVMVVMVLVSSSDPSFSITPVRKSGDFYPDDVLFSIDFKNIDTSSNALFKISGTNGEEYYSKSLRDMVLDDSSKIDIRVSDLSFFQGMDIFNNRSIGKDELKCSLIEGKKVHEEKLLGETYIISKSKIMAKCEIHETFDGAYVSVFFDEYAKDYLLINDFLATDDKATVTLYYSQNNAPSEEHEAVFLRKYECGNEMCARFHISKDDLRNGVPTTLSLRSEIVGVDGSKATSSPLPYTVQFESVFSYHPLPLLQLADTLAWERGSLDESWELEVYKWETNLGELISPEDANITALNERVDILLKKGDQEMLFESYVLPRDALLYLDSDDFEDGYIPYFYFTQTAVSNENNFSGEQVFAGLDRRYCEKKPDDSYSLNKTMSITGRVYLLYTSKLNSRYQTFYEYIGELRERYPDIRINESITVFVSTNEVNEAGGWLAKLIYFNGQCDVLLPPNSEGELIDVSTFNPLEPKNPIAYVCFAFWNNGEYTISMSNYELVILQGEESHSYALGRNPLTLHIPQRTYYG